MLIQICQRLQQRLYRLMVLSWVWHCFVLLTQNWKGDPMQRAVWKLLLIFSLTGTKCEATA